jgi:hypothetical protein
LLEQRDHALLVNDLLSAEPALAPIIGNPAYMDVFARMLSLPSSQLFAAVHAYVAGHPSAAGFNKRLSRFQYEGQTPWGGPTKVTAHLEKDGHPTGSSAGGDSSWMLNLEQRADEKKTMYVRGHMLNRHLGGAGLDHNMVPLTGRAGWKGSNDANGLHSSGIEEHVKSLYRQLAGPLDQGDTSKVTNLTYVVEAQMGDHARPQTAIVAAATQHFSTHVYQQIRASLVQENTALGNDGRTQKFVALNSRAFADELQRDPVGARADLLRRLHGSRVATYGFGDPTVDPIRTRLVTDFQFDLGSDQQCIAAWAQHVAPENLGTAVMLGTDITALLADSDLRSRFSQPIANLPTTVQQSIRQAIAGHPSLATILDAVSPNGNHLVDDVITLKSLLEENRDLWRFEDVNVPVRLRARATWNQHGRACDTGDIDIPNVLPSDVSAPYRRRDE